MNEDSQKWQGSLCQVLKSESIEKQESFLLRVANFNVIQDSPNKSITSTTFYPLNDKQSEYQNILLLKNPWRGQKDVNAVIPCVWEREDELSVDADRTEAIPKEITCPIHEVISLDKIAIETKYNDVTSILDSLISGIQIKCSYEITFPILLEVASINGNKICLELTKSNTLLLSGSSLLNTLKVEEGETLNTYLIPESDLISSEYTFNHLFDGVRRKYHAYFVPRIFYRRTRLPTPVSLEIHPFISLLTKYITSSATTLESRNKIKKNFEELETCLNAKKGGFHEYLTTLYPNKNFEEIINQYVEQYKSTMEFIKKFTDEGEEQRKFLIDLVEHIPELKKKYSDILLSDYLGEERKRYEEQLKQLEGSISQKNAELFSLNAEMSRINEDKLQLAADCQELINKQSSLKNSILASTSEFMENIRQIKDVLNLSNSNSSASEPASSVPKMQIVRRKSSTQLDLTEISAQVNSFDEFSSVIAENLRSVGFISKHTEYLSKIILGAYLYHIPILCTGSTTQKFIDALTVSLIGKQTDVLCVPSGFSDYDQLLETVHAGCSEIVVLDNIVSSTESYCYLHLHDDIPDKFFIFVENYIDSLQLVPLDIYSHLLFIDCDRYYKILHNEKEVLEPITYPGIDVIKSSLEKSLSQEEIKSNSEYINEYLSEMIEASPLRKGFIDLRIKLLAYLLGAPENYASQAQQHLLDKLVLSELVYILSTARISEESLEKIGESSDLGQKLQEMLNG